MLHRYSHAGVVAVLLIIVIGFLIPTPASAQLPGQQVPLGKRYISRFDSFSGFSYMASPSMNLYQRGYNTEFGVNWKKWLAIGADYSILTGNSSLRPVELAPSVAAQLAPMLPLLPPGYNLVVPFSAKTQTFSAGPQINFRQWKPITFFVRPALGLLHEEVTLKPSDAFQTAIVHSLAPTGKKSDTTMFYGFGGGMDFNISDHFAIRVGVDVVHMYLFEGLLKEPRNTVRISIGPTARFGNNIVK